MKKRYIRKIGTYITVILILNLTTINVKANPSIQDQINKNNQKQQQLQQELSDAEKEINNMQEEINKQQEKLQKAIEDVRFYQNKIDELQIKINNIQNGINQSEEIITAKKNIIEEKARLAKEANEMMDERVRSYYKTGGSSQYLYMILNSESLMDAFHNTLAVTRLINLDKNLISECEKIQRELAVEVKKVEEELIKLESDRKELQSKKNSVEETQKEFIAIENEQKAQMDKLESMESAKKALRSSIRSQILNIADETKELQERLEAAANDSMNSHKPSKPSEAGFIRPVNGAVSSGFGYRIHPITGYRTFHKGVDFANGYGTIIKASKSGVVGYSGWMQGYGKVIIINHSNGQQTVYAHQQALYVNVGDSVQQGQAIGEVGSTGNSTGPHLHFEIRINGQCVDPMKYL